MNPKRRREDKARIQNKITRFCSSIICVQCFLALCEANSDVGSFFFIQKSIFFHFSFCYSLLYMLTQRWIACLRIQSLRQNVSNTKQANFYILVYTPGKKTIFFLSSRQNSILRVYLWLCIKVFFFFAFRVFWLVQRETKTLVKALPIGQCEFPRIPRQQTSTKLPENQILLFKKWKELLCEY